MNSPPFRRGAAPGKTLRLNSSHQENGDDHSNSIKERGVNRSFPIFLFYKSRSKEIKHMYLNKKQVVTKQAISLYRRELAQGYSEK